MLLTPIKSKRITRLTVEKKFKRKLNHNILSLEGKKRFIKLSLFLHRKSKIGPTPTFEMRWASAEDFMELKVMPRMLLDHFPDNILKTLTTVLEQQKSIETSISSLDVV